MKIGIDISQMHAMNKGRGIGFYTDNLISALKKFTDAEIVVIESADKKEKVDLIHYPFFDFFRPTLKVSKNVPTVVTIHDVVPLIFPDNYPSGLRGKLNFLKQKSELKKVKAVVTDSDASKKDISNFLPVSNDKISTVHLAPAEYFKTVSEILKKEVRSKYNLPEKFVLYVGDINFNKNIINLLKAVRQTNIQLVICGRQAIDIENIKSGIKGPQDLIRTLIGKKHPEIAHFQQVTELIKEGGIVRLGFVPDDDLVAVYNLAEALLLPSYYEGFGLPILEAQACGIAVITSNNSSMKEIAGDGALLVSPDDVNFIAGSINNIVKNSQLKKRLVEKGFENLKRFSWEKAALETVEVYRKCI